MLDDLLHIFYPRTYTLGNGKQVKEKFNPAPYIVIAVVLISLYFMNICKVDWHKFSKNIANFFTMLDQMFPPRWEFWRELKKPMIDTMAMSLLGTAFGSILALPTSFYVSNNFHFNKTYLGLHRGIIAIFRTIPTLVIAKLLSTTLGVGTLAGTLAITIFTYTIAVKMMYEQIETIDMKPLKRWNRPVQTGCSRSSIRLFRRSEATSGLRSSIVLRPMSVQRPSWVMSEPAVSVFRSIPSSTGVSMRMPA